MSIYFLRFIREPNLLAQSICGSVQTTCSSSRTKALRFPFPGLFLYTANMPAVVLTNICTVLGLVNGATGTAVGIVIDQTRSRCGWNLKGKHMIATKIGVDERPKPIILLSSISRPQLVHRWPALGRLENFGTISKNDTNRRNWPPTVSYSHSCERPPAIVAKRHAILLTEFVYWCIA